MQRLQGFLEMMAGDDARRLINDIYRDRLQTLRILYDVSGTDGSSNRPLLGRIELGVLTPTGSASRSGEVPTFGTSAAPRP